MNVQSVSPQGGVRRPKAEEEPQVAAGGAFAADLLAMLESFAGSADAPQGQAGTQGAPSMPFAGGAALAALGERSGGEIVLVAPEAADDAASVLAESPEDALGDELSLADAFKAAETELLNTEGLAKTLELPAESPLDVLAKRGEQKERGGSADVSAGLEKAELRSATVLEGHGLERTAPRPVVDQLVEAVRVQLLAGGRELRVSLDPPELGEIRLVVRDEVGSISVKVAVASAEVRQAVEAGIPQLEKALAECGIDVGSFDVWVEDGSSDAYQLEAQLPAVERAAAEEAARPAVIGPDGVDAVA